MVGTILCFVVLPLLFSSPAQAASTGEVNRLLAQPCPRYLAVRPADHFPPATLEDARRGVFPLLGRRLRLRPRVNWRQDPIHSHTYRIQLHSFFWSTPLAYLYRQEGDLAALRQARSLLLDWIRQNPRGASIAEAWQDKVVADRAGFMSYFTRAAACEHLLSRRQAGRLLDAVRAAGAFSAFSRNYNSRGNHGLFQDYALVLIKGYFPYLRGSGGWARLGSRRYLAHMRRRTTRSGVWREHSGGYQVLAYRLLNRFIEASQGFATDSVISLQNRLRLAASWLVEPDGLIVPWGDSDYFSASQDIRAVERQGASNLGGAGWAMFRQGGSWLGLTASYFSDVHKHADDTSFDLFDRGVQIISDSGRYTNDMADRGHRVAVTPRAHSVLTVDGRGFGGGKYGSGILGQAADNGWYALVAANPRLAGQGVELRRYLFFAPGRYLVVVDRVRARRAHTYRRYFHWGGQVEVSRDPANGAGMILGAANGFQGYWQDNTWDSIALTRANPRSLLGYYFPSFRRKVPRYMVVSRKRARSLTAVSVINLQEAGQVAVQAAAGRRKVVVRIGSDIELTLQVDRRRPLLTALDPG